MLEALCRIDGWRLNGEITGESGLLARAISSSRGVGLGFPLRFERGEGKCVLLRQSRLFAPTGRWRVDAVGSADAGWILEWRIRCTAGVDNGDQVLVAPETMLYFSATVMEPNAAEARRALAVDGVSDTGGLRLSDGRISLLQGSGPWGAELNHATGYARLEQVGTFDASPAAPM